MNSTQEPRRVSDAAQYTDRQLALEAEAIVAGRYGTHTVYTVLKRLRDDLMARIRSADAAYAELAGRLAETEQRLERVLDRCAEHSARVEQLEELSTNCLIRIDVLERERDALRQEKITLWHTINTQADYIVALEVESNERDALRQKLLDCAKVAGALSRTTEDITKWRDKSEEATNER